MISQENQRARQGRKFAKTCSAALLGLALSPLGFAQDPQPELPRLGFSQPTYEAGETAVLTVSARPGDVVFLLGSFSPGPTMIPYVGEVQIGMQGSPMVLRLPAMAESGEMVLTCDFKCGAPLTNMPYFMQAVSVDTTLLAPSGVSNQAVLNVVNGDCGDCAAAAEVDEDFSIYGGGHALWLPGIATDLVFTAGGQYTERSDGTAYLLGVVESESNPELCFLVDIEFGDRMNPGTGAPVPAGSPKLELEDAAYLGLGGSINPDLWHYFQSTQGTLTGLKALTGAMISVERMGPAFQVGQGASGKNLEMGASGWLTVTIDQQPNDKNQQLESKGEGDINIAMGEGCEQCATEGFDHSFALPGIGKDFLFVDGGEFIELDDGTALLSGIIEHADDPNKRFEVEVLFTERMNPGAGSYPPADSPKLELDASAYLPAGPIDTEAWHYYMTTEGTLIGLNEYEGGIIAISRFGPAFQVGLGASGKSMDHGASGWLTLEILQQPDGGDMFPDPPAEGDINITVGTCE